MSQLRQANGWERRTHPNELRLLERCDKRMPAPLSRHPTYWLAARRETSERQDREAPRRHGPANARLAYRGRPRRGKGISAPRQRPAITGEGEGRGAGGRG